MIALAAATLVTAACMQLLPHSSMHRTEEQMPDADLKLTAMFENPLCAGGLYTACCVEACEFRCISLHNHHSKQKALMASL